MAIHRTRRNGHRVAVVCIDDLAPDLPEHSRNIVGSLFGVQVAAAAARAWKRPYFRGGTVDMSARHIQVS